MLLLAIADWSYDTLKPASSTQFSRNETETRIYCSRDTGSRVLLPNVWLVFSFLDEWDNPVSVQYISFLLKLARVCFVTYNLKNLNSCSLVTIFRRSLPESAFWILELIYFFKMIPCQALKIPGSSMTHTVLFIMNSFSPEEKQVSCTAGLRGNGLITQLG